MLYFRLVTLWIAVLVANCATTAYAKSTDNTSTKGVAIFPGNSVENKIIRRTLSLVQDAMQKKAEETKEDEVLVLIIISGEGVIENGIIDLPEDRLPPGEALSKLSGANVGKTNCANIVVKGEEVLILVGVIDTQEVKGMGLERCILLLSASYIYGDVNFLEVRSNKDIINFIREGGR